MAEINIPDTSKARKELFRALAYCLLAVILVRSFLFELFKIPSSSMVPTLAIGDHIVVSKFNYGLTFPFTTWEFAAWSAPKRGDVIVFIYPKDESLYYIKRVIGIPGDKIEFRGRDIFLNGQLIPKAAVAEDDARLAQWTHPGARGEIFVEDLGGVNHPVQYSGMAGYEFGKEGGGEQEVPEEHFFVMGDNRDDSYDSRSWGAVPRRNIRGKAQMIWLSLDRDANWSGGEKIRWSRSFSLIR